MSLAQVFAYVISIKQKWNAMGSLGYNPPTGASVPHWRKCSLVRSSFSNESITLIRSSFRNEQYGITCAPLVLTHWRKCSLVRSSFSNESITLIRSSIRNEQYGITCAPLVPPDCIRDYLLAQVPFRDFNKT